jgi:hypothetical protein
METVFACFGVLSRDSPRETEENQNKCNDSLYSI